MTIIETNRHIPLEAVHNFRDLGGYPTEDGRVTRWRRLFRSDGLDRLTAPDIEVMRDLGIRTVIDLRTQGELDERGRFPVAAHPVAFHHLPVIDVTWDPDLVDPATLPVDFLLGMYLEMLASGEAKLAHAFRVLALPEALPAVFHCAAGKDRTGLLAGLLLSALGVPDEHVVADYALTAEAMERMVAWLRANRPDMIARLDSRPSVFMAADPGAMAAILALIRDVHGSTREYMISLGVPSVVLDTLEDALLEPS